MSAAPLRHLSVRGMFFQKRALPTFWFGGVALSFCAGVYGVISGRGGAAGVVFAVVMAAGGWVVFNRFAFELVDEVWDAGAELVVKTGARRRRRSAIADELIERVAAARRVG